MTQRTERVARSVQEELGDLMRQIKDPRVTEAGFVTVTHVRVSPDLGQARVLVSLFGSDAQKGKALIAGLESARGFLEREIGRRLHAKKVPRLTFLLDETAEKAGKLDAIFAELDAEKRARGEVTATAVVPPESAAVSASDDENAEQDDE